MEEENFQLAKYKLTRYGSNGLIICCHTCGAEFEETDNGHYPPIMREYEQHNRSCKHCRDYNNS